MGIPAGYSVINSVMQQATMIDYPGRMSALMFTSGCNFRCGYCHNFESLSAYGAKTYSFEKLGEICDGIKRQWTHAITITGGEPTMHPELPETIEFLKKRGFAVKLDTNGSNPDMVESLISKVDFFAMDLKCPLVRYDELVKYGDVEKLRRTIALIMGSGKDYEFRTTLVEPYFTEEDWHQMGEDIRGAKRYAVQAFVPHDNLPDVSLRELPRTRPSVLEAAAAIMKNYVQKVVIHGA